VFEKKEIKKNETMKEKQNISWLASALAAKLGEAPDVAVVLGSGWAERADGLLDDIKRFDLNDFEHWPLPRVQGHAPELRLGRLGDKRALLCGGRVHAYEGYSAAEIVRPVRAMIEWGVTNVLLLNAAGSTREELAPGTLMALSDHLNFGLPNPLTGPNTPTGAITFVDLVDLYDPTWRAALTTACPDVKTGVYSGMLGPSYETPAEVAMVAKLGGDAVGMSTIPEAIAARAAGARGLAISMMTNLAAGVGGSRPNHQEVLDTAAEHGKRASEVLAKAVLAAF